MITDNLLSETHNIEVLYNALKLIGEMDVKAVRDESWMDNLDGAA
jgi:hypothetical protein